MAKPARQLAQEPRADRDALMIRPQIRRAAIGTAAIAVAVAFSVLDSPARMTMAASAARSPKKAPPKTILIVGAALDYQHDSISDAMVALSTLGKSSGALGRLPLYRLRLGHQRRPGKERQEPERVRRNRAR